MSLSSLPPRPPQVVPGVVEADILPPEPGPNRLSSIELGSMRLGACARRAAGFGGLAGLLAMLTSSCGTEQRATSDEAPVEECPAFVEDGGGGIEQPPEGAALCPAGACNYQTASGCDASETCLPTYNANLEISPGCTAAGAGTAGDECVPWATPSDCASGHFCAEGVCRRFCCGSDWSACDADTSCFRPLFLRLGGEANPVDVPVDVGLCFPTGTCHVLDPDSCEAEPGKTCKIVDPTGAVACLPSGPGVVGDDCSNPDYCGPSLSCVGERCRRLCRVEACGEPGCPADEGICVHLDRDPEGVGECTPNFLPE